MGKITSKQAVKIINSIAKRYPHLRQAGKPVTFSLQYAGNYHTLMNKFGFSETEAKQIEHQYHELYKVSDQWVHDKLIEASNTGYIELAFGVRLRTPMLAKIMLNSSKIPYEAQAEARSAGNALGQSWGQLNNRAAIAFMENVHKSEYRTKILPIAHIHDAQYFLIENSYGCVKWLNDVLVAEMLWQEDPMIEHPDIPLGGELELFYPSWETGFHLPNNASKGVIQEKTKDYMEQYEDLSHGEHNG